MNGLKRLQQEFKQCIKDPNPWYSVDICNNNLFEWNFIIMGPQDTLYDGGIFKGKMEFEQNYPMRPPSVKFTSDILHPNIYPDGRVCISILHEGLDQFNYEHASERWNPSQGVNSIMLSIISMLSDPNTESPANVSASKLMKEDYEEYKKKVYSDVSKT
tara:strand:+ start:190 stop:666 length:477 start_codon:yes stop_codon:yes gene_type:complete